MFMSKIVIMFYVNEVECNSNGKHNKRWISREGHKIEPKDYIKKH